MQNFDRTQNVKPHCHKVKHLFRAATISVLINLMIILINTSTTFRKEAPYNIPTWVIQKSFIPDHEFKIIL